MPTTQRPEFNAFDFCVNTTSGTNQVCKRHPEFLGWEDGNLDKQLSFTGYTGLAHYVPVTLAVVADQMISKGKNPSTLTNEDCLGEMRDFTWKARRSSA